MPEFITYNSDTKGEEDFEQVIARIPRDKILWPQHTTVAQAIFHLLNDEHITSPEVLYTKLSQIQTQDLRPHFLMLLKGFEENGTQFQISYGLFQTLHKWIELKLSHLHGCKAIRFLTVEDGLHFLKLNKDQEKKFTEAISHSPKTLAEKTIFYVPVNDGHVIEMALRFFGELTVSNLNIDDYLLVKANLSYLNNYSEVFWHTTSSVANRIPHFIKQIKPIVDAIKTDEKMKKQPESNDVMTRRNLLNIKDSIFRYMHLAAPEHYFKVLKQPRASLLSAIMLHGSHPLFSYQYDDKSGQWFFPFLGPHLLRIYYEATFQIYRDMFYCYGKILPQELIYRFINHQPRLGNLVPFSLEEKDFQKTKVHGSTADVLSEIMLHDYLHQAIQSAVGTTTIINIVSHWIKLIGEKTKLYCLWNNENIPYTHETWSLTDFGFENLLHFPFNRTRKFHKVFETVFFAFGAHSAVVYLIILDMVLNNFYMTIEGPKPKLFRYIEESRELIISVYKELLDKPHREGIDPFVITSICAYTIINQKYGLSTVNFKSNTVKEHYHSIDYSWEKQNKFNTARLLIHRKSSPKQKLTLTSLTDAHLQSFGVQPSRCTIS